ncbi:hypothetical protein [Streptomyces sp. NPDC003247]|uniref:hypothetical protein n=1 Tax=Streptomyces sp. NPDC003247 TaxID=3364677 RepID=UPI00368FE9C7
MDAALLLDVTVGPHPLDRFSLPATGERCAEAALAEGDPGGLRIAADPGLQHGPVDREPQRVFAAALRDPRAAGAVVEELQVELPDPLEFFVAYWGPRVHLPRCRYAGERPGRVAAHHRRRRTGGGPVARRDRAGGTRHEDLPRLPEGVRRLRPRHADAAVVSAAARYERATDWCTMHPTL